MIVSEYVRGLKNNYVRIRELALPDERKYQYCIMKRGGISGLLSFEIRYIDSDAYMYYDITSRQNISTLYSKKPLGRSWLVSFFSSMKKIRNEAVRFLLDPANLIWNPENIYQDLKTGKFGYLYVPYLNDDNGMSEMMDFLVNHVDYSDEELVKCVYSISEQYKSSGDVYLSDKVYSDIAELNAPVNIHKETATTYDTEHYFDPEETAHENDMDAVYAQAEKIGNAFKNPDEKPLKLKPELSGKDKSGAGSSEKHGIFDFISRIRAKDRKYREDYDYGYGTEPEVAVAEEPLYSDPESDEDIEGTVFVELPAEEKTRRLTTETGQVLHVITEESFVIGKKEDEVDLFMNDEGISRMHARIIRNGEDYYVEDLNSTNGTFKNGLRLKPYERRKLVKGDEIKLAARKLIFS